MKLNLSERLNLVAILPAQGSFATLRLIRELKETLSLSEEEIEKYEVKHIDENSIKWNSEKGKEEVEIKISDFGADLIKKTLRTLDEKNQLKESQFTLYEKFVGD